jgi:hypothetical protein
MKVIVSDARGGMTHHTIRIHSTDRDMLIDRTRASLELVHGSFTTLFARRTGAVYFFRALDLVAQQDVPINAPRDPNIVVLHRQLPEKHALDYKQAIFRHRFTLFSFDLERSPKALKKEQGTLNDSWRTVMELREKYPRHMGRRIPQVVKV